VPNLRPLALIRNTTSPVCGLHLEPAARRAGRGAADRLGAGGMGERAIRKKLVSSLMLCEHIRDLSSSVEPESLGACKKTLPVLFSPLVCFKYPFSIDLCSICEFHSCRILIEISPTTGRRTLPVCKVSPAFRLVKVNFLLASSLLSTTRL